MSGASQAAHTSLFDGSKRSPLKIKSYTQVAFVMPRFPISLKYRKCFGLPMGSSV